MAARDQPRLREALYHWVQAPPLSTDDLVRYHDRIERLQRQNDREQARAALSARDMGQLNKLLGGKS